MNRRIPVGTYGGVRGSEIQHRLYLSLLDWYLLLQNDFQLILEIKNYCIFVYRKLMKNEKDTRKIH